MNNEVQHFKLFVIDKKKTIYTTSSMHNSTSLDFIYFSITYCSLNKELKVLQHKERTYNRASYRI